MQEAIAEEMEQKRSRKHGKTASSKNLQLEGAENRTDPLATDPELPSSRPESYKQLTSPHAKTQKVLRGASYKADKAEAVPPSHGEGLQINDTYDNILQSPQGVQVAFDPPSVLSTHEGERPHYQDIALSEVKLFDCAHDAQRFTDENFQSLPL